jgi:DNA-binding MarR family transcriptional regulator
MTTAIDRRSKDPLAELPGYVLRRASAAALAELNQRLAPLGLRHADVALLLLVDSRPGMTQSDAGRILDVQRANMVPFVGRLRRRGLIERRRVDGRSQALALTGSGCSLLARARAVVEAHERALIDRVPRKMRPMVLPILLALWDRREP